MSYLEVAAANQSWWLWRPKHIHIKPLSHHFCPVWKHLHSLIIQVFPLHNMLRQRLKTLLYRAMLMYKSGMMRQTFKSFRSRGGSGNTNKLLTLTCMKPAQKDTKSCLQSCRATRAGWTGVCVCIHSSGAGERCRLSWLDLKTWITRSQISS